eukprot:GEMP01048662.1.p1 GENE.GEMP01048662.1~~GEMP01048662.1.p1  ORF type:complete len:230 (+),score=42.28 GEMP01048662.1:105-794(+)
MGADMCKPMTDDCSASNCWTGQETESEIVIPAGAMMPTMEVSKKSDANRKSSHKAKKASPRVEESSPAMATVSPDTEDSAPEKTHTPEPAPEPKKKITTPHLRRGAPDRLHARFSKRRTPKPEPPPAAETMAPSGTPKPEPPPAAETMILGRTSVQNDTDAGEAKMEMVNGRECVIIDGERVFLDDGPGPEAVITSTASLGEHEWQCQACTFHNSVDVEHCAVCGTIAP